VSFLRRTVNMLLPEGPKNGPDFRKRVEWLMLLRLLLTTLLLGATIFFQLRESRTFFVDPAIPLYVLVGAIFFLSLVYAFSLPMMTDLRVFSFVQVVVDVLYTTVLVYFTGGASSVFTLLYGFPIVASGILHHRRGAIAVAFIASGFFCLLLNLEFYNVLPTAYWPWVSPWSHRTPDYILWVLVVHITFFFICAVVAGSAAEQLQSVTISLRRTESDYTRLADLHMGIVRSIPSGIITADENDKVTFVNTAGVALLATPLPQVLDMSLKEIFPALEGANAKKTFGRGTKRTVQEMAGEMKHLDLTVSELKGRDGISAGQLVIFDDVTRLRQMEERVGLSEKQAAFVRIAARMAHEIRNPLAAVRGATELLSQITGNSGTEKRLFDIVIRESDRLNSLLNDFLQTVATQQPQKTRLMLTDLVEETVALFAREPRIREGIALETIISKGIEVAGDSSRLRQALWNLLTNALDASPDGGTITVILQGDEDANQAVIKVQDSGPGIPTEMRDKIFEPFVSTKEKGTGLGLALVLNIVEAHNGTVEAHSEPGEPTVFVVRLPLADSEPFHEAGEGSNG
jgi:two-component system sensor histidine kinase PilS (NtrC family)